MTNRELLIQKLEVAPDDIVQKMLNFLNQMQPDRNIHPLDQIIGTISDEDAAEMQRVIREDCRQVDKDEW